MKTLVCPHCQTQVAERANVCTGFGAEIVRGASRRERSFVGVIFALGAIFVSIVILRALEIAGDGTPLPSPRSNGAVLIFFGLIGLLVIAYISGKSVARIVRRSQVRFYRTYRHQ